MIHAKEHDLACALAAAIDFIDNHECEAKSVATAILMVLMTINNGADEVDLTAGSVQVGRILHDDFPGEYWQESTVSNRMKVLMAAVATTETLIKEGRIDADIRRFAAETVEEANGDDKVL